VYAKRNIDARPRNSFAVKYKKIFTRYECGFCNFS